MCKNIPFNFYRYYLACERDCNNAEHPIDFIKKTTIKSHPGKRVRLRTKWFKAQHFDSRQDIVTFAQAIFERGCYRGGKDCSGVVTSATKKIKAIVRKLPFQHYKLARNVFCGTSRVKGLYTTRPDGITHGMNYNSPFDIDPSYVISAENYGTDVFIDQETGEFDGCAAVQKVLDGKDFFVGKISIKIQSYTLGVVTTPEDAITNGPLRRQSSGSTLTGQSKFPAWETF